MCETEPEEGEERPFQLAYVGVHTHIYIYMRICICTHMIHVFVEKLLLLQQMLILTCNVIFVIVAALSVVFED